ncbi:MAG TPA: hypothetical protein IAA98_01210 [Candidatus Avipropionibacterium avicola]|uniref:Uncharacterized protein n=1 Tax=Candidatus Avipropionibacterium avicola TaxID=2840701 RepID=A0A9D1GW89_9ACTN|nr:hypothetical protein [Candidatus Avipropionibacterium avicola]
MMRLVMILRLHVEDQGPDDTAARIIAALTQAALTQDAHPTSDPRPLC